MEEYKRLWLVAEVYAGKEWPF